jgi:hypothetical protein
VFFALHRTENDGADKGIILHCIRSKGGQFTNPSFYLILPSWSITEVSELQVEEIIPILHLVNHAVLI